VTRWLLVLAEGGCVGDGADGGQRCGGTTSGALSTVTA
jgi:hypothetical protein